MPEISEILADLLFVTCCTPPTHRTGQSTGFRPSHHLNNNTTSRRPAAGPAKPAEGANQCWTTTQLSPRDWEEEPRDT